MANTNKLSAAMRNLTVDAEQSATKTTTAVAQVLGTPELLEAILSHLPVLDLVMATGISNTFRNVVQASPQLQQKLFMSPSKDKADYWQLVPHKSETPDGEPQSTHLYHMESPADVGNAKLQAHLESVTSDPHGWADPRRSLKVVSTCPWLCVTRRCPECLDDIQWRSRLFTNDRGPFNLTALEASLSWRILGATKHWTNMFLTSPPCHQASLQLVWNGYIGGEIDIIVQTFGVVHCEDGVTLAMLVDELSQRNCLVQIFETNYDRSQGEDQWIYSGVRDTTLHEQVDNCRMRDPKIFLEMSPESVVYLPSVVAPTQCEYEDMALHGHVVVSA